ncbi:hypothetical protein AMTRI_Chr10g8520 [Amborella trichopoda]|uniref:DYW domain-containing protein n=1 Tax=Amborella trichopoda TaxID=13333 RepID=U5DC37_AMBTC|nr:pentatricopeptide repeat-containing protein At5g44230 [Amborella trichopoda]ERN19002.1 hypothetical protein AMTR_s00061p00035580 [Amborella trichopoda]|eukprot:XP_006857535.1 pentatricopeptide repeat-containing protein At5g44230 [Amborella trichopoda]
MLHPPLSSNITTNGAYTAAVEEQQLLRLLDGCTGGIRPAKRIHAHIIIRGLAQSNFLIAKLLRKATTIHRPEDYDTTTSSTSMDYSQLVFEQVSRPNAFLWTTLIRAYALRGGPEAFLLYNRMAALGTPRPISFTFSALFKACSASQQGKDIQAHTLKLGFDSDLYVQNTLIDLYVRCGCVNDARRVFDTMPTRDIISWTAMIVAYAKGGDMEAARCLFDSLPHKDMVSWTAMLSGYAQNAKPQEALQLFEEMKAAGVPIDEVTLVGAINACAQLGVLHLARQIHSLVMDYGGPESVVVGSALIDMYAKCGSLKEAYQVFEKMTVKNVFSYSAMIGSFAMHGHGRAALRLFSQMQATDIPPNSVTFIGVLAACSHTGLVEEGVQCFATMQDEYRISPSADHYACMVDLLGRAGRLEEAHELLKTMPIKPHAGVWGALLGACRIHGNANLAEVAAKHLFEVEPDGIGNYVLLSNIYAAAKRWDDVRRVRKEMRGRGLRKNPGCSWVEGKEGVQKFFAGDVLSEEIETALEELLEKASAAGYVPKLDCVVYDVSDGEKEQVLKRHSEKVALAFGLLTMESRIRIVKNLRMCDDCHLLMCVASRVAEREIVVRDNMRFHHFKQGACSCGEFW